ncbi:cytochrome P450 [Zopfia rhizophila CBS 207.26]|uniref:Cytochrome P450 n=1 Tax=Zopfia rhizophila CBS 207.26 TaxID=1314779 RepID=A0A6A6DT83_9PEZI|nr:cytochrome P450 [Zopfia rhizophila CBS 207.26]
MVSTVIQTVVAASFIYTIYTLYYRLYLSPIAIFPGPKLAAATFWYEFYYDIVLGGKYIWKIRDLHRQYGSVIRINPYELHVSDPNFWDTMYTASTSRNRRDKWAWQTKGIGIDASILGTAEHALHRHRRTALNSFFSMQNVRKLLPVVEERVNVLVQRLKASGDRGEIVSIEYAFSAFTNASDVVMKYCFGQSDYHIEAPGFDPNYHNTSFGAAKSIALLKHMNWILKIMLALPESIAERMGEEVSSNIRLKRVRLQYLFSLGAHRLIYLSQERINQIEDIRRRGTDAALNSSAATIFHTLLESDLPESEKDTTRLAEEAVLLVGAGTHTTSWVLTVIAFHLLSQPTLLKRLKEELEIAIPNSESNVPLDELEKLPYLTAVLKEGLRLGYGTTVRSARVAPDTSLKCGDWIIPPGTPVSMTIPLTHHDESIFPDSDSFNPGRWLGNGASRLEKYLVSFSKGSRACLGLNLAWAELYLCTAGVFRLFGSQEVRGASDVGVLELYETDIGDVALVSDMFFPVAKEGSKGVRVKVSAKLE